ncbi:outer membrane beta-barrel protein [Blastochloris tepida]|uniref:Outer membrane beta-barrel protein n=1 Tax=Blastochloris tepida TaxID=2233851 RepID=A0A348G1Z3_9HYPH|nr:outer membrane beta-barrel protein [Blastochloris tepida]BBF93576.1 hypothetical protein BLTE_22610 [Blastochloris tepida]
MPHTRFTLLCFAALGALAAACGQPQAQEAQAAREHATVALRRSIDDTPSVQASVAAPDDTVAAPPSGAGTTGFVAEGTRRKPQRAAQAARPVQPAGRVRPEPKLNRRAFDDTINAVTARSSQLRAARLQAWGDTPVEPTEPFDPLGIRAGSFLLKPWFESGIGYDTNPLAANTNPKPSLYQQFASGLSAQSDWSRHALAADIRGSYTQYDTVSGNNRPEVDAILRGRIDVSDRTRYALEGHFQLTTESAGNPDAPTDVVRPPPIVTTGGSVGFAHRWNRLDVAAAAGLDHVVYENGELLNGETLDRSDRNYDQPSVRLRTGYELRPGVTPFVAAEFDSREFANEIDSSGYQRASTGMEIRAGTSFELSRLLTGEASLGWIARNYVDPRLADISGLLVDASLVWVASGLTTVRFTAVTTINETSFEDTTGVLERILALRIDHAFRRWLIGTIRLGWEFDDYGQSGRRDNRFVVGAQASVKLARELWLTGEVRQETLDSNEPVNDYTANIMMVGLRLQR